jgi:hypothetical protein
MRQGSWVAAPRKLGFTRTLAFRAFWKSGGSVEIFGAEVVARQGREKPWWMSPINGDGRLEVMGVHG